VKRNLAAFLENIAESASACLVTMVQGNLMAVTLTHWLIASETGIAAGALASVAMLIFRTAKRWMVAVLLGVTTAVVDFFVHRGELGPVAFEAVITGLFAGVLSYLVGVALRYRRAK
jgi:hypothetical protein